LRFEFQDLNEELRMILKKKNEIIKEIWWNTGSTGDYRKRVDSVGVIGISQLLINRTTERLMKIFEIYQWRLMLSTCGLPWYPILINVSKQTGWNYIYLCLN